MAFSETEKDSLQAAAAVSAVRNFTKHFDSMSDSEFLSLFGSCVIILLYHRSENVNLHQVKHLLAVFFPRIIQNKVEHNTDKTNFVEES